MSPKRCQYGHRWGILFRVGVRSLLASEGLDHIDKSSVVLDPSLSSAGLLFLLLPGLNLEREELEKQKSEPLLIFLYAKFRLKWVKSPH